MTELIERLDEIIAWATANADAAMGWGDKSTWDAQARSLTALRAALQSQAATIARLTEQLRRAQASSLIVAEMCAQIPVPQILKATGTGQDLINWFKQLRADKEAAESRLSTIEQDTVEACAKVARDYRRYCSDTAYADGSNRAADEIESLIRRSLSASTSGGMDGAETADVAGAK